MGIGNMVCDTALSVLLRPLWEYLDAPNLIELSVNAPGEVGLEIAGKGYQFLPARELDYGYWLSLCHVLANLNGIEFHPIKQPRVSTAIPGGHRFEAMIGKNVEHELSVSIRLKRKVKLELEDFGLSGKLKQKVIDIIERGANIIISGGTSSGKTTFLNNLVQYIPKDTRILTVEDTRELDVPHKNCKSYLVSRNEANPNVGYSEIIDHLMRSRPDLIIAGEVSVVNSFPIIRMLNSGHAGFLCTVHANSPELALTAAIPQNIRLAGLDNQGVSELLYQTIDLVLQLHRTQKGIREVTEILFPKTKTQTILNPDIFHNF